VFFAFLTHAPLRFLKSSGHVVYVEVSIQTTAQLVCIAATLNNRNGYV